MVGVKEFKLISVNVDTVIKTEIPLAPTGVLAYGSAHALPSVLPPIDTIGIFLAHMSEGGG